jgi:hypothetical protein
LRFGTVTGGRFLFVAVDTGGAAAGPVVGVGVGALTGTGLAGKGGDADLKVTLRPSSLMKRDRVDDPLSGGWKSSGGSDADAKVMNFRQICAG